MVKVTCKYCSGTRTIPDDVARWQCKFCMKKNQREIPKVEEPIVEETIEESVDNEEYTYNVYDSQETL